MEGSLSLIVGMTDVISDRLFLITNLATRHGMFPPLRYIGTHYILHCDGFKLI
jgi:hypothetical protein